MRIVWGVLTAVLLTTVAVAVVTNQVRASPGFRLYLPMVTNGWGIGTANADCVVPRGGEQEVYLGPNGNGKMATWSRAANNRVAFASQDPNGNWQLYTSAPPSASN